MKKRRPDLPMTTAKHLILLLLVALAAGCRGKAPAPRRQTSGADSTAKADTAAVLQPARLLTYEEGQGSHIYARYCAVCHGAEGKGDGFNAFNLDPRPHDFSDTTYMRALGADQIVRVIGGGGRSMNKSPLMPAWGWTLTRGEILSVAAYVRSFSGL